MQVSDVALLKRWLDRSDADAFAELISRHSAMVYATGVRILRDPSLAEDVAQESFAKVCMLRNPAGASLAGLLHTIATRQSLDRLRNDARRRKRESDYASATDTAAEPQWDDLKEHIDEAVVNLPVRFRGPLVSHLLEGDTHKVIADNYDISQSTVRYRIQQGIERTRRFLKRRGIAVALPVLSQIMESNLAAAATPSGVAATLNKLVSRAARDSSSDAPLPPEFAVFQEKSALLAVPWKIGLAGAAIALVLTSSAYFLIDREGAPSPAPSEIPAVPPSQRGVLPQDTAIAAEPLPAAPATSGDTRENFDPADESPRAAGDRAASITGRVIDGSASGEPIPSAEVTVLALGTPEAELPDTGKHDPRLLLSLVQHRWFVAIADGEGRFEITDAIPSGLVFVWVYGLGYATAQQQFDYMRGEEIAELEFVLEEGVTISGHVTTSDASPVQDALVLLGGLGADWDRFEAVPALTFQMGEFRLGVRSTYFENLSVRLGGFIVASDTEGQRAFMNLDLDPMRPNELVMPRSVSLRGTVRYVDGTPAEGTIVRIAGNGTVQIETSYPASGGLSGLAAEDGQGGGFDVRSGMGGGIDLPGGGGLIMFSVPGSLHFANVDSSGNYRIDGLDPAQGFAATFLEGDYEMRSAGQRVGLLSGKSEHVRDFILPDEISVYGVVTGAYTGVPLDGVRIWAEPGGSVAQTTAGGAYELKLLGGPNDYILYPHHPSDTGFPATDSEFATRLAVSAGGRSELNLTLGEAAPVTLHILSEDGRPIQGAKVRAIIMSVSRVFPPSWSLPGISDSSGIIRDADGRLNLGVNYEISHGDYLTGETGEISPGATPETVEFDVVLYSEGGVRGKAVDGQGMSLANAPLSGKAIFQSGGIEPFIILTDEDGAFFIPYNFPGQEISFVFSLTHGEEPAIVSSAEAGPVIAAPGTLTDLGNVIFTAEAQ